METRALMNDEYANVEIDVEEKTEDISEVDTE